MVRLWVTLLVLWLVSMTTLAQTTQYTLEHDDIDRTYRLFVPDHYDPENAGHLIFVLHGGGMTASEMVNVTGQRLNKLITEHELNAIVVYPDGVGHGWNDGRIREGQISYNKGIDDVDFLMTLADTLANDYNIMPDELFFTGFSNGAGMSFRTACEHSDRITAIAPVSNLMASTFTCNPQVPVAVLSIIGDEDPILPLSGGDLYYWDMPLGSVLSLDNTLAIWHDVNDCDGYSESVDLPDTDPNDETTISQTDALDCEQPISSIIIHGGGHTWAGSPLYMSIEEFGRTSNDIDAGELIFDFFDKVGLAADS